jgi:hypothetical protein
MDSEALRQEQQKQEQQRQEQQTVHEQPVVAPGHSTGPDWRIWLALSLTTIWLLILAVYVAGTVGWANIGAEPIERVGSFLEGAFAPLAFLWLVVGYFLQHKELSQNTAAIKMQYIEIQKSAEQAVIQSKDIHASEQHARKQSFLQIAESVRQHLGSISAFLFLSSQGASGNGLVTEKRIGELWGTLNNEDPEGFSRSLLQIRFTQGIRYAYKLLYGTQIRTTHCENFIFNFERLLESAKECDDNGMVSDALLGSAHGRVYRWMIDYRDNPPEGFHCGVFDFDPDSID